MPPFNEDSETGLTFLANSHDDVDLVAVGAVALAGIAALFFANHRHVAGCPCPNCDPPGTGRIQIPMSKELMLETLAKWGPSGPPSLKMGEYVYNLPDNLEQYADSTQMALQRHGHIMERRAFVDRVYLELLDRNPVLKGIAIQDPRARHWVVVGALSRLSPAAIKEFVKESTG